MNAVTGFFTPWLIYAVVTLLHRYLPARIVTGYVENERGARVQYRINGLRVFIVTIALWLAIGAYGLLPWNWLFIVRWPALGGAICLGLIYTAILVVPQTPVSNSWLKDMFLGRRLNQSYDGFVDAKMLLYLIGAVMLALNTLSFTLHHWLNFPEAFNPGIVVCAAMLLFFVLDYLVFEHVHLYTYDLFAERLGFKLAWGCLAFYPFFYTVALWSTVELPASELGQTPWWWMVSVFIFLGGWCIARGANMQKYSYKLTPERPFLGFLTPQTLSGGNQSLLVNGYWGLSRHINYLGEILMATGIAMASGHIDLIWPWLYPLYYIALLLPRERDDDQRCAEKYGTLWQEYREKVPRRVIPFIY